MRPRAWLFARLGGALLMLVGGCGKADQPATRAGTQRSDRAGAVPTILLAQAQFLETTDENTGKVKTKPGAARLVILRKAGEQWQREVLEDPESNVFHKAAFFKDPGEPNATPGILTIGANAAAVKLWHRTTGGWSAETLWQPTFGGKQDRLRDVEIGDVTGDDQPDIAVVTHDQGVVAVLTRTSNGWEAAEVDRRPGIWVHEVELGDLDGDGVREIYATPSNPNRFDGKEQPGEIVSYRHTAEAFQQRLVEKFPLRHVKEILVTDLDSDGRPVLLASVEAEFSKRLDALPEANRTLINRYRLEADRYVGDTVCTLPGGLCRFLNAGDVDGDGKPEVVASTYKDGIWLARPGPEQWTVERIDHDSSSFEHATTLADLDHDGVLEIYVAADDQRQVRRYRWTDGGWDRTLLSEIEDQKLTFGICVGEL